MRLRTERTRFWTWARLTLGAAVSGLVLLPIACSEDDRAPPASSSTGGVGNAPSVGPCTAGASQKCGVTLGEHNGVLSCYVGTQYCEEGVWGQCTGGEVVNKPSSKSKNAPGSKTRALGPPTPCTNNPCDPYCQNYDEPVPDGGVGPDADQSFLWPTGGLGDLPGGSVNKALKEPCFSALDCQLNNYCKEPKTGTSCAHSKCETGTGLDATCDTCVGMICAADPTCCPPTFDPSCDHDPCLTGTYLKAACDPCVAQICAAPGLAYCCTVGAPWDAACQAAVSSVCGLNCGATWSQSCVNQVKSVCDAQCGTGAPPPESAQCEPWLPGETDPTCAGVDLSGGIPCGTTIPVCNHGNTAAPAGIRIIHFPESANQFASTTPDQTDLQMLECLTNAPIPPGQCVSFDCPNLGNTGNRDVMINPPPGNGLSQSPECSYLDNWTIYAPGTACGVPSCAGGSELVHFEPVIMYVQIDKSGSMGGTKWDGTINAMTAFFQSPGAAGLGAALEFFPLPVGVTAGDGCGDASCVGGNCAIPPCANPMVPAGFLTAAVGEPQELALVAGLNSQAPGGGTPTYPALAGALSWATTQQAADPDSNYIAVLITDGDATQCTTDTASLSALAQNAFNNSGVRTYTIGMDGANITALDSIAAAGGTTQAIVIQGTNQNNIEAQLVSTFQGIASSNISCTFPLPSSGNFDPNNVTMVRTSSTNVQTTVPQVTNAAACVGDGWYFDDNLNPTAITLCTTSCTAVQTDPGASIGLSVGCPQVFLPTTMRQVYEAQCPAGTKPQWGFMSYDTTTPSTATVQFNARTATTQAGLSAAGFTSLATAQASPDTQVCPLAGPAPCPLDLYTLLGTPDARYPWLELEAILTPSPSTAAPILNDWQITYSCPPAE